MGIRMVRQPSETPNVTNIDDIIPFRYAYGDQNGYVIGKGSEISPTIQGNTFRVNSGRIVLQGVETDIDANGVSFTIDNASETRYFVVYYEVNLATQTTAIKLSNYSSSGYPTIDAGDDLTANSSGIARTELYRFTATSGVISNVTKVAKAIEYSGTALVGYDISKGTVEDRLTNLGFRLTNLGFKTGSISVSSTVTTTTQNYLYRQGNYVIGKLSGLYHANSGTSIMGTLPTNFKPLNAFNLGYAGFLDDEIKKIAYISISADGVISVNLGNGSAYMADFEITFGYEAKPL